MLLDAKLLVDHPKLILDAIPYTIYALLFGEIGRIAI